MLNWNYREYFQDNNYKDLNILTAYSLYIYSCINFVNQPELKYENHYNTHNKGNLKEERHRLALFKNVCQDQIFAYDSSTDKKLKLYIQ